MALAPHFQSPLLNYSPFDPWDNSDIPPISLKHLSQNLNFLERQYHIRSKSTPKLSDHTKIKLNFETITVG